MSKEIYISSTPHETRLAIAEDDLAAEVYYERENEYTLAGSIYKGRVTRVLPGMQSAFVDVGLERDAFLYVTDFLEEQEDSADFERIPAGGERPGSDNGANGSRQNRESRLPQNQTLEPAKASEGNQTPASSRPDADIEDGGNRRLRGRRGRRRGRGGDRPQTLIAPQDFAAQQAAQPGPSENEAAPPFQQERQLEAIRPRQEAPPHPEPRSSRPSAPATGFVLPGESLSKYGSTPASTGESQQAAPTVQHAIRTATLAATTPAGTSRPSTLVEAPLSWDGGMTLPGESLSRHRSRPSGQRIERSAPETHQGSQAAENSLSAEPAEAPFASSREEAAIEFATEVAIASGAGEATLSVPGFSEATVEPAHESTIPQEPIGGQEHEQSAELSASHNINPVAPVEFRSKWADETAIEGNEFEVVPPETRATPRASAESGSFLGRLKEMAAELFESHPAESPTEQSTQMPAAPGASAQDSSHITHLEPSGAMHSEMKVNHENAVGDASEAAATAEPLQSEASGVFSPGEGLVEEETIYEEEMDYEPRVPHANSDEPEFDELEEETRDSLDSGDLGDILRDAQIENETRYLSDDPEEETSEQDLSDGPAAGDVFDEDIDAYEAEVQDREGGDEAVDADAAAPAVGSRSADRQRPRRGSNDRRFVRGGSQRGGPRGRRNTQTANVPIISELLKQGQEILVQIAKEPIARKGARITSHIALPGRYLVFMPTVNHVGVSRKISSDEERRRLKHILLSEKGDAPGGFIVRTAAGTASEEELRADIRFLINLWTDVKQRADAGKAPALIYHDLSLVERVLRDQVTESFSTIWVDTEADYERVLRFLQRFQPAMVRRVKLYTKETPLFEQFGIQDEINKALRSKVWLKSGGSIVINQTEALVAIDINTGKYVGKTARLEDTIIRTNLDAIPEIVRQIRLRDLGGIIVIDFIDMDERKNRQKVMQALEEALKADRAPSKVLQFNDFGLVAITRKRVKQSLERTLSTQCTVCTGTGMVKSPVTVCNEIYVEMRKMHHHLEGRDVLLRVHPEVVTQLKSSSGKWLNELEEVAGKTIILKSDPTLQPEQFDIH